MTEIKLIDQILSDSARTELGKLEERIQKLVTVLEKGLTNVGGGKSNASQQKELTDALTKINQLEKEQAEAKKKVITLSDEERVKIRAANRERQLQAQYTAAAAGSYAKLSAEYRLAEFQLKNYSKAQLDAIGGKKKLIAEVSRLNTELKKQDGQIGNSQRNVGNYQSAIGKAGLAIQGLIVAGVALAAQSLKDAFSTSIEGALDEEKSMQRLSFAIKQVSGGSDSDIALLAKQAEDLMGIFSHEEIEGAATKMLNFGLTVNQVNEAMPLLVDAAAQGQFSMEEIASAFDKGVNSGVMARSALGQLGLAFKDTGDKTKNYNLILQGLTKLTGGNEAAMKSQWGTMQNLKIRWDEVKEALGAVLLKGVVPLAEGLASLGRIFESTQAKMARSSKNITLGRINDLEVELTSQKNKIKYIDEEIKAERGLYKAQQNQIEINNQKIASNTAAGGAWLKNNKALQEQNAGLQIGVNRHIDYVNALSGMRQKLKEGSGAINTFTEDEKNNTKQVDKLSGAYNKLALQLAPAINSAKDIASSDEVSYDKRQKAVISWFNMKYATSVEGKRVELKNLETVYKADKKTTKDRVILDANYAQETEKILLTYSNEQIAIMDEAELMVEKINKDEVKSEKEKADEIKKIKKDAADEIARVNKDAHNERLKQIQDEIDLWNNVIKEQKGLRLDVIKESLSAVSDLSNSLFDVQSKKLDKSLDESSKSNNAQLDELEKSYKAKLISESDYNKKKAALAAEQLAKEEEIQKKKDGLERDQFFLNQAFALANVGINLAQAISNPLNMASGGALTPLYIAIAGIQTAAILAQTIPYFEHGGVMGHDGMAVVGDGGRHEVLETPSGGTFITPNVPTMIPMEKGTIIYPDAQRYAKTVNNETMIQNMVDMREVNRNLRTLIAVSGGKQKVSLHEQSKIQKRLN